MGEPFSLYAPRPSTETPQQFVLRLAKAINDGFRIPDWYAAVIANPPSPPPGTPLNHRED